MIMKMNFCMENQLRELNVYLCIIASANEEFDFEEERKYAPWMTKTTSEIRNPNVRLHNEIIELTNYIMPKKDDYERRQYAIQQLTSNIKVAMPNVEIKSFGSFSTKLYLPNADIDLVLQSF